MQPYGDITAQYAEFADHAAGSPTLAGWSRGVVDDPEVMAWIATLPGLKKQPNIVFAAARWHGVPAPGPYAGLREALLGDDGSIRATILSRATQTNEVGRLATLVPAFAMVSEGRPIALIEAGASAGLNLFPDRWGYAWSTASGEVTIGPEPRLPCRVSGPAPLPDRPPSVAWRGGIDLNPLDVGDPDAMAWLETLVWPEDDDRRVRLHQAVEVARADPPLLVAGDVLDELPALVDRASAYGPVVVFHSAVVAYFEDADRVRFQMMMTGLVSQGACQWVSNEAARVLPDVAAGLPSPAPTHSAFVLGINGHAVAWAHGHGRELRWLDGG